jgi:hypothetical protein
MALGGLAGVRYIGRIAWVRETRARGRIDAANANDGLKTEVGPYEVPGCVVYKASNRGVSPTDEFFGLFTHKATGIVVFVGLDELELAVRRDVVDHSNQPPPVIVLVADSVSRFLTVYVSVAANLSPLRIAEALRIAGAHRGLATWGLRWARRR